MIEKLRKQSLCEEVSQLMLRGHKQEFHEARMKLFTNKMAINLKML
ncbi:hypothetical protein A2U01_0082607, partial [Trifolium medium]|nr:hypothetical protein [Trifolium medium]